MWALEKGKWGLFASWRERSCCCLGFLPRHSWSKVILGVCCVRAFCPFDFYVSSSMNTAVNKEQVFPDFTFSWSCYWKGECMFRQLSVGQGSQCCLQPWAGAAHSLSGLQWCVGHKALETVHCWHPLCLLQGSQLSSRDLLASPGSEHLFNLNTGSHPGEM